MWYIVIGYMIFSSSSCIIQRWHIMKNSDKMSPCLFSWLRLKPSMGVSQSFAPGKTAGTPILCCYVYLWTHFVYFSCSFISLWCLLLRLQTIWVLQPVQQPFCLPILVTRAVFSLFILPGACYLLIYGDQFLKPICLFFFDILKHNNIRPVCWRSGVAAGSTVGKIMISAALSSRPCGCSCMCVTLFSCLLKVVLFEFLV